MRLADSFRRTYAGVGAMMSALVVQARAAGSRPPPAPPGAARAQAPTPDAHARRRVCLEPLGPQALPPRPLQPFGLRKVPRCTPSKHLYSICRLLAPRSPTKREIRGPSTSSHRHLTARLPRRQGRGRATSREHERARERGRRDTRRLARRRQRACRRGGGGGRGRSAWTGACTRASDAPVTHVTAAGAARRW